MKLKLKSNKLFRIAALSVAAILLGFLLARGQNKQEGKNTPQPSQEKIEVSGVKINDFLEKNEKDASFVSIEKTRHYHVFYIPDQELFYISITSYPFDEHREAAEAVFLEKLGVAKEDACKLNVDITTPSYANPQQAGKVYELSWCNEQR